MQANYYFQPAISGQNSQRHLLIFTYQYKEQKTIASVTLKNEMRDTNQNQYHSWLITSRLYLLVQSTPVPYLFLIDRVIILRF